MINLAMRRIGVSRSSVRRSGGLGTAVLSVKVVDSKALSVASALLTALRRMSEANNRPSVPFGESFNVGLYGRVG
jgi:hypothetical protein